VREKAFDSEPAKWAKKSTACGAFLERIRSERHFFQHFNADFACSDFAQGGDAGLVFALNLWAYGPGSACVRDKWRPAPIESGWGSATGSLLQ
jgi:hypothetical protein